jgi:hypothetical protein
MFGAPTRPFSLSVLLTAPYLRRSESPYALEDKGTIKLARGNDWSDFNASTRSKVVSVAGIITGLVAAVLLVAAVYRGVKQRSRKKVAYAKLDDFENNVASFSALSKAEQEMFEDEESEEEDLVFHSNV